jgi:oligoribonuclease NrnB/cAMP/cGMP phosphodiesterase (DHH superfamily)
LICIYHRTDFDGKCAGAIVKHKFPHCKLYPLDYADPFDLERIEKGEEVIMVDFTLEKDGDMENLIDRCGNLVWIDHHRTAIALQEKLGVKDFPGIRQVSTDLNDLEGKEKSNRISGCELTWMYFYPERKLPYSVYLLGRYDIWEDSHLLWKTHILPFQYGMRLQHAEPDEQKFWISHFRSDEKSEVVQEMIFAGNAALAYDENLSERIAKGLWFPIEFEGFKFQAINRSHANSHSAKSIWNPEEFDAIMYFCRGPHTWRITMFTSKPGIDLYPLAKKLGGGGHSQACGFTVNNIMEVLPQLIEF